VVNYQEGPPRATLFALGIACQSIVINKDLHAFV
jgi:hypothetical protein